MSQEALADAAEISRSNISGLERGTRTPSALTLLQIAKALDVPPSKLFEPQDLERGNCAKDDSKSRHS